MDRDHDDRIGRALEVLRSGGLVAIPTETVYGLGADADNAAAVRRVFSTKGRPADHPLIVHIADADAMSVWAADVPDDARTLAARFWPGPLTLVLWRATKVLDVVTGGLDTVALRSPDHPDAIALLRAFGGGIAAPSANRFGRVSPTCAAHVAEDLGGDVDFILDGGPCRVGLESTIVDLTGEAPVILRPGMITADAIEAALGRAVVRTATGPSRAPGMLRAHYAPRARVELISREGLADALAGCRDERVGVLRSGADMDLRIRDGVRAYDLGSDQDDAARRLYAALRLADHDGVTRLLVVLPPEGVLGPAVEDRLRRAAAATDS